MTLTATEVLLPRRDETEQHVKMIALTASIGEPRMLGRAVAELVQFVVDATQEAMAKEV